MIKAILSFRTYLKSNLCVLNEDGAIVFTRRGVISINHFTNKLAKLVFFESWLNSLKVTTEYLPVAAGTDMFHT